MACGLCIVSTDVGGIPYLLAAEEDALLVPPKAPEEMANAVRRILDQPALAESLSSCARRHAEQLDWAAVTPRWDRLLLSVARPGSASAVAPCAPAEVPEVQTEPAFVFAADSASHSKVSSDSSSQPA